MPPLVMDLDLLLPSHPHSYSRTHSLSTVDNPSVAALTAAHRRRSSASQIIPIASQGTILVATVNGTRRSPLAPLDPQLSILANKDLNKDMAHDDKYQSGRKSSVTLTNATRPTPYVQRNLPRRHAPGQQRRTSLPALHPTHEPPPPLPPLPPANLVSPYELEIAQDDDADMYSRLSTFTFGDAQSPTQQTAVAAASSQRAQTSDDTEAISPLDRTPRPSVAHVHAHALAQHLHGKQVATNGWSSPSEDEEDQRRTSARSKMRAIDDGSRRPSLPSNDYRQLQQQQQQHGSSSGLSTDKGKGRAHPDGEREREKARQPTMPISPTSPTEGEPELDTDVDLLSADDTDRRRRGVYHGMSDRSSIHISSDVGSVYGDDGKVRQVEERQEEGEPMDEDETESGAARKDSARTFTEITGRRGSLPMDIPYPSSNPSARSVHAYAHSQHSLLDDSFQGGFDAHTIAQAQLRRPSRSVDDDLQRAALHLQRKASRVSVAASVAGSGHGLETAGSGPSSEPDMRGVAMAQAIAQAHLDAQAESGVGLSRGEAGHVDDDAYQGLDLNYILSVSGGGLGSSIAADKQGSDQWSGRLSVGSSVVAARDPSWAAGWGFNPVGRRQSTATVNDDTFLRFVKKHDYSYDERKREWTFARETSVSNPPKPGQEIWRCLWVGRYRVDRVDSKNADPAKPLQIRLNIRHLPDPYSKASTRGGPLTFIHKHSRAQAFSIFRGHSLPQRHLKTSSSILLAPKKVQEQFTSTRTTSKLSTHGLLEDASPSVSTSSKRDHTASGSGTNSATTSTTSVGGSTRVASTNATSVSLSGSKASLKSAAAEQQAAGKLKLRIDKEKTLELSDNKGKNVLHSPITGPPPPSSGQTITSEIASSSSPDRDRGSSDADTPISRGHASHLPFVHNTHRPMEIDTDVALASSRPVSSIAETASIVSDGSHQFSSALSAWDQSSIGSSQRHVRRAPAPPDLRHQIAKLPMEARGSVGSLEEQPMRTSHAEAFATLDPPFIEYLRMHSANYDGGSDHDSQPSRFKGLRKLFHPQPLKNTAKHSPQGPAANVAVLEGHYTPPWLTMAARSKQEEQERVIKNLNDSFRDVGLLPSFKPNRNRHTKKGKRVYDNVFDQIPDESLYMLLPMWPGETDPVSASLSDVNADLEIPLHERQYLLVYYVPNELSKGKSDDKKRTRGSQTSSAASHHSEASSARGEGKNQVALSSFNILARLVTYKDVNGSGIRVPSNGLAVTGPMDDAIAAIPQIRFQADDLALMIAFCANRERGVEVVPEGAEKLGLCLPRTNPDPDSDAPLSPLGRAAVEMAWLGALAIMGFGSVG